MSVTESEDARDRDAVFTHLRRFPRRLTVASPSLSRALAEVALAVPGE